MQATASLLVRNTEAERTFVPLALHDVSPSGAFFSTHNTPPVGAEGEVRIVMRCSAMQYLRGESRFAVRMGARVVRCTEEGFGVRFDPHYQAIEAA